MSVLILTLRFGFNGSLQPDPIVRSEDSSSGPVASLSRPGINVPSASETVRAPSKLTNTLLHLGTACRSRLGRGSFPTVSAVTFNSRFTTPLRKIDKDLNA